MIAEIAGGQAGRVARWQLRAVDIGSRAIECRLASGHLHPEHAGVYATGHPRTDALARRWGAVLAGGPAARISHRTAGAVWGLRPDNRFTIDVTAPTRLRDRHGVRMHRGSLHPADLAEVDGLPVTAWPRTILDIAPLLGDRDLQRVLERVERLRLFDLTAFHELLGRANGHRGVGALRRALADYAPDNLLSRSELEVLAFDLIAAHGLPRPERNAPIGPYEADLLWRDVPLVAELDSWEFHRTRAAFERDRRRDRWLAARGIPVIRFTQRALTVEAAETFAELAAALGSAA